MQMLFNCNDSYEELRRDLLNVGTVANSWYVVTKNSNGEEKFSYVIDHLQNLFSNLESENEFLIKTDIPNNNERLENLLGSVHIKEI